MSGNGVAFNVNVDLTAANGMAELNDSDHVIAFVDGIQYGGRQVPGAANNFGGKVAFVDADYFSGLWDSHIGNTRQVNAAHEIGHLFGLPHHSGRMNIMRQGAGNGWFMWGTQTTNKQMQNILHNYQNGKLNKGSNYEIMRMPSPSSPTGYIDVKRPNRWLLKNNVNY